MNVKIKTQKEITTIAAKLKREGKRVVTFNGSFDVLHIGHIKSIKEAKSKGDVLIILLNSDASIQSYKGPARPIISQDDRAETLSALNDVGYVTIFDEINPLPILDKIKPDIHCNGSDWGKHCVEREVVEKNGGKIHILKWQHGYSTTSLIKKIIDVYAKPTIKAIFLDRDGTINENRDGYIHKIEDFKFTANAVKALQELSKSNYKIIIITNQSGIGRGYYTEDDLVNFHKCLLKIFEEKSIRIDDIYYCPHAPDEKCFCRKPATGLLLQTVKDYGISLNDSWVIGDDPRDIIMGRMANVKTIKIGNKMPRNLKLQPNHYATNLYEAVNIIL